MRGGVVALNGAGGIGGGTKGAEQGFFSGGQLFLRNFSTAAGVQLAENFVPRQLLLVKVDARAFAP